MHRRGRRVNFFIWVGIALTVFCLGLFLRDDWRMLSCGRRFVRGTIIGHRRDIDEGSPVFIARVRFEAEQGGEFETTDMFLNATPEPGVGTELDVVYPAGRPDKARVHHPWWRALLYGIFLGLLGLLTARLLNVIS